MTFISFVEQERRADAEDEGAAMGKEFLKTNGLSSRWGWDRHLSGPHSWAGRSSTNARKTVRFPVCISKLNAGDRRRNTGLIQNFAVKSNFRNCLAFLHSLSCPILDFFPLFLFQSPTL